MIVDSTGISVLEPYTETVTFEPSETEKTITLTLIAGQVSYRNRLIIATCQLILQILILLQVPAPQAVFTVRLNSAQAGISLINNEATVSAIASTTSVYSFSQDSR